jgi:DNA-binding NarL/FixJ family response regulator
MDPEEFEPTTQIDKKDSNRAALLKQELESEGMQVIKIEGLTPTLNLVACLLFNGYNKHEISQRLGISPSTAKAHTRSIKVELNIKDDGKHQKLVQKLSEKYQSQTEVG